MPEPRSSGGFENEISWDYKRRDDAVAEIAGYTKTRGGGLWSSMSDKKEAVSSKGWSGLWGSALFSRRSQAHANVDNKHWLHLWPVIGNYDELVKKDPEASELRSSAALPASWAPIANRTQQKGDAFALPTAGCGPNSRSRTPVLSPPSRAPSVARSEKIRAAIAFFENIESVRA
jgi:hypothetical protein